MTASPPVPSPNSILPPSSYHCAFIPEREKIRRCFKKCHYFSFVCHLKKNCVTVKNAGRRIEQIVGVPVGVQRRMLLLQMEGLMGKNVGGRGAIDVTYRHYSWVTGRQRMTEMFSW